MKLLIEVIVTCLLVLPASAALANPFEELNQAILKKDWAKASEALTRVSAPELLYPMKDKGENPSRALWISLFPDEGGDPDLLAESAQFSDEQQAFLDELLNKQPLLVDHLTGPNQVLPIYAVMLYLDEIVKRRGEGVLPGLEKKMEYLLNKGASLDALMTINDMTTTAAIHLGFSNVGYYSIDVLFEKTDYDFLKLHTFEYTINGQRFKRQSDLLSPSVAKDGVDINSQYGMAGLQRLDKWLAKYSDRLLSLRGVAKPNEHIAVSMVYALSHAVNRPFEEGSDLLRQMAVAQLMALVKAGLDPYDPLPGASSSFSLIRYAESFGLVDLMQALIDEGYGSPELIDHSQEFNLAQAISNRNYERLDLILANGPPTLLNQRMRGPKFIYKPGVLNVAVGSILKDGDVAATMKLIRYLIQRGASVTKRSGANYNLFMEVGWTVRTITYDSRYDQNRPQLIAATRRLGEQLQSKEFADFIQAHDLAFAQTPGTCSEALDELRNRSRNWKTTHVD